LSFLKRTIIYALILTMLGLAFAASQIGSAGAETATATRESRGTLTPTPEGPREVTFEGQNDRVIPGLFYRAPQPPAPTLLLLNFRHSWSNWAPTWSARGFNVVAFDEIMYNSGLLLLNETNRQDMQEILLVMEQLNKDPAVIPHQFAILGGSLMGGYALMGCARSPDCRTAILLSPTNTAVDVPDPMAVLGDRSILIVASKGEMGIADTARAFDRDARGEHRLILYDWGYHASAMFYAHPELVDIVGDWLVKYLPGGNRALAADQATPKATEAGSKQ
jgi:hypothetical protein